MLKTVIIIFTVTLLIEAVKPSRSCQRASRQFNNCDYQQNMTVGNTYYVYNPGYPNKYNAGASCRWVASTLQDNKIDINCELDIPSSSNCLEDRLSISTSGDPEMRDAKHYCGKGTFQLSSWDNYMTIVLSASQYSRGGSFLCSIIASPQPCNCGWRRTNRIVGGTVAQPNEFPMMAALIDVTYPNNLEPDIFCGGTIISKRDVLTAAHCVLNRNIYSTKILVGEHDIRTNYDSPATQNLTIEYFLTHELFNINTQQNDIAIVRATKNILYSGLVGPACLPFRYQNSDFTGVSVEAMGWGSIAYGEATSPVLKKTSLFIQSQATCSAYYPNRISYTQFCTYGNRTDTCQNDSGGPLIWFDSSTERYSILGTVSYGKLGCATRNPAVNTNVAKYISWIIANTPSATYCYK